MNNILENKTIFYVDEIRNLEQGGFEPPVTCEIDPSNTCNLNCLFCMYKDRPDRRSLLPWESYCALLTELKELGVKSITFTGGGEPLTHPKINSMVERAALMGFELGLVTNGTLLDRVERPAAFTFIRVSLDAGDAETYRMVKGADLFDRVVGNVQSIMQDGVSVGLSFVQVAENEPSKERARDLAEELGVMYIQFKGDSRFSVPRVDSPEGDRVITMERFPAEDSLPCRVAGLIGVVGADERLYFCCQLRGVEGHAFGRLGERPLGQLFRERMAFQPDVSKCPTCRYMNYVVSYRQLMRGGVLFFDHRRFL